MGNTQNDIERFSLDTIDSVKESITLYLSSEYKDYMKDIGFKNADVFFVDLLNSFKETFDHLDAIDSNQSQVEEFSRLKTYLRELQVILNSVVNEFLENKFENLLSRPNLSYFLELEMFTNKVFPTQQEDPEIVEKAKLVYDDALNWLKENDPQFDEFESEFQKSLRVITYLSMNKSIKFDIITQILFSLVNSIVSQNKNFYEGELQYEDENCIAYAYARLLTEINVAYKVINKLIFSTTS